jgi:hypothetical protein
MYGKGKNKITYDSLKKRYGIRKMEERVWRREIPFLKRHCSKWTHKWMHGSMDAWMHQ